MVEVRIYIVQSRKGRSLVTYLIPLGEDWVDPAVVLRGTASKARTTLKKEEPRKVGLFLGWLEWFVETRHTSSKKSQSGSIRLLVVDRDIEEQLANPQFSWKQVSLAVSRRAHTNHQSGYIPGTL